MCVQNRTSSYPSPPPTLGSEFLQPGSDAYRVLKPSPQHIFSLSKVGKGHGLPHVPQSLPYLPSGFWAKERVRFKMASEAQWTDLFP